MISIRLNTKRYGFLKERAILRFNSLSFPHTKVVPSASNADFFIFRNVPRRFLAMVVLPSLVHGLVQDASQV